MPAMASAAIIALMVASSAASTVAAKIGSSESLGTIFTSTGFVAEEAPELAVENAMKMSPESLPEILPSRPRPSVTGVQGA
jgi:hypothetical protein